MEKNIAHPTDARLYERARAQLTTLAQEAGVDLRQSYARLAPRLALQVGRYAHAKQFRRMCKRRCKNGPRKRRDDLAAGGVKLCHFGSFWRQGGRGYFHRGFISEGPFGLRRRHE